MDNHCNGRLPDPRHDEQPAVLSQCQLASLVSAAKVATTAADWEAIRDTAVQHLGCLQPLAKSHGVAVKVLLLQAQALKQLQQHEEALQALDVAIQLQPACSEALWLRAAVHAAAGHHTAAFMDLRSLSQQQPNYPGLMTALQEAAHAVAQQQASRTQARAPPRTTYIRTTRRAASQSGSAAGQMPSKQTAAYAVLGLQPGASLQEVRRAYKQLTLASHPDKLVLAGASAQALAEERFKQVAAAYQVIADELANMECQDQQPV